MLLSLMKVLMNVDCSGNDQDAAVEHDATGVTPGR